MKRQKSQCKGVSFEECELAILRIAVDKADEKISRRNVNSPEISKIMTIVEDFIKEQSLICYGGTAINNILPQSDQFYNKDVEIPDYDFYSPNALDDAIKLADIYYKRGFTDVEAKSGQHHGTYKVFVNYIPVADISFINKEIFNTLKKDSIKVAGISYAPPNFLRMSMYLELSRPAGDISRWEKVLKRLMLLNKNFPLKSSNCKQIDFQREMSSVNDDNTDKIFKNVETTFTNQGVIFFGGYAISQYSQYMPSKLRRELQNVADFEVLSKDPETTAQIVKERLKDIDITNVTTHKREAVGDIVPIHYEVKIGDDTVAFIYKPIACHSYNVISIHGRKVKIATIDTMLSFYLAFLYTDRDYYKYFADRILCMSQFLFEVQQKNRLSQKGLLRRFSITCFGHQESVEEMRANKSKKFKELKNNRNSKEFKEWFLNYKPEDGKTSSETTKNKTTQSKTKSKTKSNTKSKTKSNTKSGMFSKSMQSLIYGKTRKRKKITN
tara:strand:+ start:1438 stop:2928 length:1491 start_codon:yes stop_codon:yes gene_type:complete